MVAVHRAEKVGVAVSLQHRHQLPRARLGLFYGPARREARVRHGVPERGIGVEKALAPQPVGHLVHVRRGKQVVKGVAGDGRVSPVVHGQEMQVRDCRVR